MITRHACSLQGRDFSRYRGLDIATGLLDQIERVIGALPDQIEERAELFKRRFFGHRLSSR